MIASYIRPIAVAVIKKDNKVLGCFYKDKVKNQNFYRLIGGRIEFGEKATEALHREFKEELNEEIKINKLLTVVESIFNFEGHPGHKICFVYGAEFTNHETYKKDILPIIEPLKENEIITWADPEKDIIYPINPKNI